MSDSTGCPPILYIVGAPKGTYDAEMNDLIKDLCDLLYTLEWWQSGDTSEDRYREKLSRFKAKWFKGDRKKRLKGYIDEQIGIVRSELYSLIGEVADGNE